MTLETSIDAVSPLGHPLSGERWTQVRKSGWEAHSGQIYWLINVDNLFLFSVDVTYQFGYV